MDIGVDDRIREFVRESGLGDDFERWLLAVSVLLLQEQGIHILDLGDDLALRESFEGGVSPETFFRDDVKTYLFENFGED